MLAFTCAVLYLLSLEPEYCLVRGTSAMNSSRCAVAANNGFIEIGPLPVLSVPCQLLHKIYWNLFGIFAAEQRGWNIKGGEVVKSGNMNDIFCEIQFPKLLTEVTLLVLGRDFFSKLCLLIFSSILGRKMYLKAWLPMSAAVREPCKCCLNEIIPCRIVLMQQ